MDNVLKLLSMHNVYETGNKVPPKIPIYGFAVDTTNSDPADAVTYIEDAVGMTPATNPSTGNFNGGTWLDVFPFNVIRPVALNTDGSVKYELSKDDFSRNSAGNTVDSGVPDYTMIEIPPVYWKFTTTDTGYEVRWSEAKVDDSYQALAHERGSVLKGNLYVGAYEGYLYNGTHLLSKRNQTVYTSYGIGNFRISAENNGNGYGLMNFYTLTLLQILFVTMFKSLNSQTTLGGGYCNMSGKQLTGKLYSYGMYYGNTSSLTAGVKFMGIENLWGNTHTLIDGIIALYDSYIKISDNTVFNNTGAGYKHSLIDQFVSTSSNYISQTYGSQIAGFLPKSNSGATATSYYCDYGCFYVDKVNGTSYVPMHGGYYSNNHAGGIFNFDCIGSDVVLSRTGARIQYLAP